MNSFDPSCMRRPCSLRSLGAGSALVVLGLALGAFVAPLATSAPLAAMAADEVPAAETKLWTCGMHPQVVQDHPGECPICHMELTPLEVGGSDGSGHGILIDPVVVQNMGLRTSPVVEGPVAREVRVAGFVEEAEPLIHDVSLRVSGWIERLHAHTEGLHLEVGDPLFDLYSPELQVAVEELIALGRGRGTPDDGMDDIRRAAVRKLVLLGLDPTEVDRLSRLDSAPATITFRSPVRGNVTEKPVVEGSAVAAGEKVLRLVDHSVVWIDARVYEQDLALVSIGQKVEARVAASADKAWEGEVVFVHPHLDEATRTASVRMAVPNPGFELRPGMFASVVLRGELSPRALLVPREAVIDTGERQIAFVVGLEPGRFEPRRVRTGWSAADGRVQVLEGLALGEEVVVSGQFLLDAESRVQEALRKYLDQRSSEDPARTIRPASAPAAPTPGHAH